MRAKLSLLVKRDRTRSIFGARRPHGHRYKQQPVLSASQLAELENSFGISLPSELRAFLCEFHGGGPGPGYGFSLVADPVLLPRRAQSFPFDEADAQRIIEARQSDTDRWASLDMPEDLEDDDDDWPPGPGFVPIAHHGCGVFDVIVTTGSQRGFIWCCDMTWCPVFDSDGTPMRFLDWYENWLDQSLAQLVARPRRRTSRFPLSP